jgi:hypothetical protein
MMLLGSRRTFSFAQTRLSAPSKVKLRNFPLRKSFEELQVDNS